MTPIDFPDANHTFKAPEGYDKSQVFEIRAYVGEVKKGNLDGVKVVVTAWRPTEDEIRSIMTGAPLYISFMGGLPPHFPTTSFIQAAFKG